MAWLLLNLLGKASERISMRKHSEKGFSLVELLIVIALVAVLMAIGTPYIVSQISHVRLTRSVRDTVTELNAARLKAIAENMLMRVEFTGGDTYNLTYYDPDSGTWEDHVKRSVRTLESGISITAPGAAFNVQFAPNGAATATTICVNNPQIAGDRMRITVSGLGMINVQNGC